MSVLELELADFSGGVDVVVVGGGGCGLTAALSASLSGADVIVLEKDSSALGTTSMSTGLIPGAGSRFQKEKGIKDSADDFANDIIKKTRGQTDHDMAIHLARVSAPTVEWLVDNCSVPLSLVHTFDYPGHRNRRMHGSPNRTGSELMGALHESIAVRNITTIENKTIIVMDLLISKKLYATL